jgi:hypothetical protein
MDSGLPSHPSRHDFQGAISESRSRRTSRSVSDRPSPQDGSLAAAASPIRAIGSFQLYFIISTPPVTRAKTVAPFLVVTVCVQPLGR